MEWGVKPGELVRMQEGEDIDGPRTCVSTQRGLSPKRQAPTEDGSKAQNPGKSLGMEEKQEQNESRAG